MSAWCDQSCGIPPFFVHVDTAVLSSKGLVNLIDGSWQVPIRPSLIPGCLPFGMSMRCY